MLSPLFLFLRLSICKLNSQSENSTKFGLKISAQFGEFRSGAKLIDCCDRRGVWLTNPAPCFCLHILGAVSWLHLDANVIRSYYNFFDYLARFSYLNRYLFVLVCFALFFFERLGGVFFFFVLFCFLAATSICSSGQD